MFNMSKYSDWTDSGVVNRNYHMLHSFAKDERINKILAVDFFPFTLKKSIKTFVKDQVLKDGRGELVYGDITSQAWQITSKIYVYSTVDYLFRKSRIKKEIKKILQTLEMENNLIVYSCNPLYTDYFGAFDQSVNIFDAIDNWATHSSYTSLKDKLLENYGIIDAKSDLVYTVSQDTMEMFGNAHTKWLPNAVDYDHFQSIDTVKELADKKKPIIGFLGILQDRIDVELLKKIAKKYTDATLVLAGPVWKGFPKQELEKYPNIVFAGPVSYRNIPKFYNTFDVGIIVYKNTEFIKSTNSMKYYEYLAAGLPVVSTWSGGIEKFADVLYYGDTHDEFLAKLDLALAETPGEKDAQRRAFVQNMTWKSRVEEVLKDVEGLNG